MKQTKSRIERLLGFTFEHFQEQRKFRDLNRLSINVYSIDIIAKNALFLANRQMPLSTRTLVNFLCMLRGTITEIPLTMPADQVVISPDEKGPRATGRVDVA